MTTDQQHPIKFKASGHVILVIDDDHISLDIVSGYLEERGYSVLVAEDGESGLKRADYAKPDLIFLDIMMPGLDGFETCRTLKKMESTRNIPVIFMTAQADTEHKVRGIEAGAVDYVTKPFHREEVLARVGVHLHISELAARLRNINESLEKRVEERTAELRDSNEKLAIELSERKRVEEALSRMNERFSLAVTAARLGVWDWDIRRNELLWDDMMYELYGIKREDFTGAYEAWLQGVHPDDRALSDEASKRARSGEQEYDTEFRVVWPDGTIHYLKAYGQIVRDAAGTPLRMTGVNFDITRSKRAEDALSRLNEELEQRVRERTKELERRNYELEQMNKAFVGRELKMVELKKRISELEQGGMPHGEKAAESDG